MSIQLIQKYYAQVDQIIRYGGSRNESSIRKAFQDLLGQYARSKNLLLIPELEYATVRSTRIIPDGTLKDALRQDWGFWESKDEKDDLDAEITHKFAKGYPRFNILFEDSQTAVLYQSGEEVLRASFEDAPALDRLISLFVGYERPEVREFHKAIEQFREDIPELSQTLREIIEEQYQANPAFQHALHEFLELCKKSINPNVELADMREMVIQHVLTEDIFMRVFDNSEFHRENIIAQKLQEVAGTFFKGEVKRNIEIRISHYYETINARASQINNHHEKQKFLKALYEAFYKAYNPKAADRLGVIYTPDEIVRFMIESADHLVSKHFGKTLGDPYVEILDPATGTGTFITELIEYLPPNQLEHKYENEIHCNEVAILPYYIANLNIEFTYQQKTGRFKEFENICFVDTLDNVGFTRSGEQQMDFFGLIDENSERIGRQNSRKISVIIGNPPYNASQMNENENNKNREYPQIDKRIKETYIQHSTAQKTKLYDMYTRFLRWASDRLDQNGIIAFVSNNSFIDARSYDGFRKVIAREFNEIYIIDLKGDARTSGERRRKEGGNVFSDQIRVGVAVYFLVRKKGTKGCRIHYNAIPDYARAEEKQAYLRDNDFSALQFKPIHPDKRHNWLNLTENEWDTFIPILTKTTNRKISEVTSQLAVFSFSSLGVSTNRDEWVYDFNQDALCNKIILIVDEYNKQIKLLTGKNKSIVDQLANYSIKWSDSLKRNIIQGKKLKYDPALIIQLLYRPYVSFYYYSEKLLSDRLTSNHYEMFGSKLCNKNEVINISMSEKAFSILVSNKIVDLHFIGDTINIPAYTYSQKNSCIDNITDWALQQFQKKYKDPSITKQAIFHYVYAVLHHPAYREKYSLNLKREFPRIPFYPDFWQWQRWGQALMDLHLNYEQVEPFPLQRDDLDPAETRKVNAPRLLARKEAGVIEVDTLTTLRGVPPEAWDYRLGTYTALEWVLERHKEKTPKDPTIREKFNTYRFTDYKEKVVDLLCRVCTVSVETMRIVKSMPE